MAQITITESELKSLIKEAIQEAIDYGWEVDTDEAMEAYDMAVDALGKEYVDEAIIRCIGYEKLADCLAYIFRMNDFQEWNEYKKNKQTEENL